MRSLSKMAVLYKEAFFTEAKWNQAKTIVDTYKTEIERNEREGREWFEMDKKGLDNLKVVDRDGAAQYIGKEAADVFDIRIAIGQFIGNAGTGCSVLDLTKEEIDIPEPGLRDFGFKEYFEDIWGERVFKIGGGVLEGKSKEVVLEMLDRTRDFADLILRMNTKVKNKYGKGILK
jgi:hypothetical protein